MRPLILLALTVLPAAPDTLQVQREEHRTIAVSVSSEWEYETASVEMEMDGEPVEMPDSMRGAGVVLERKFERIDQVLEAADGAPLRVRREFVSIAGERMVGDDALQLDSPFDGLVLELTRADDEVEVEVLEGDEPDGDDALEGHRLELELEALLSGGELEQGAAWDLDGELLARALGFDLEHAFFPRPDHEHGEAGGNHAPSGGMRPTGGDLAGWFLKADWTGTARLVADDAEWEGATCLLVKLECSGSGELSEGGDTEFEAELRGELWFDAALALPVRLDVEIDYSDSSHRELNHGETSMVIDTEHVGVLHHVVEVRVAEGSTTED